MTYLFRNVDDKLWARAMKKAAEDGRNMRWLLTRLLEMFVDGDVKVENK